VRENGRIVGGEEWQDKVYDRKEWKKLLRMARNRRILHTSMDKNRMTAGLLFAKYYMTNCSEQERNMDFSHSDIQMMHSFDRTNLAVYLNQNKSTVEHAVTQWLRHCATNRKVMGSIRDGVTGFLSLT
jgi:virulence-associated protein VapD